MGNNPRSHLKREPTTHLPAKRRGRPHARRRSRLDARGDAAGEVEGAVGGHRTREKLGTVLPIVATRRGVKEATRRTQMIGPAEIPMSTPADASGSLHRGIVETSCARSSTVKKTLEDTVKQLGRYPLEAFEFLHCGLDYTVQKTHGPLVPDMGELLKFLESHGIDLADLRRMAKKGKIPPTILKFIQQMGGAEATVQQLNRHVGGEELCWGLRDLATEQWGFMANAVLSYWGIRSTRDFGLMVFALVDNGLLQKQPKDRVEDFDDIYDFDSVFGNSYTIKLEKPEKQDRDAE